MWFSFPKSILPSKHVMCKNQCDNFVCKKQTGLTIITHPYYKNYDVNYYTMLCEACNSQYGRDLQTYLDRTNWRFISLDCVGIYEEEPVRINRSNGVEEDWIILPSRNFIKLHKEEIPHIIVHNLDSTKEKLIPLRKILLKNNQLIWKFCDLNLNQSLMQNRYKRKWNKCWKNILKYCENKIILYFKMMIHNTFNDNLIISIIPIEIWRKIFGEYLFSDMDKFLVGLNHS